MDAIVTKYHGPTNNKGSRISAEGFGSRVMVPYRYNLDGAARHFEAVKALCAKVGVSGKFVAGWLPKGDGYAFVHCDCGEFEVKP